MTYKLHCQQRSPQARRRAKRLEALVIRAQHVTDTLAASVDAEATNLKNNSTACGAPSQLRKNITTRIRMLRELADKMYMVNSKEAQ